jgi:uncharacterized protein YoxC
MLRDLGSVVYLLPETNGVQDGVKHPDAVIDGYVVEFKTISGSVRQIEDHFKKARRQAENVFFKIDSSLSKEEVLKKLEGTIIQKGYHGDGS